MTGSDDGVLSLWDLKTFLPLAIQESNRMEITALRFSPLESRLVVARADGSLNVRKTDRGLDLHWTDQLDASADTITFSPDGDRIAVGTRGDWIRVYRSETGQLSVADIHHGASIVRLEWLPESDRLMAVSSDHQIRFWDAGTGLPLSPPIRIHTVPEMVSLSPDRQFFTIATSGERVEIQRVPESPPPVTVPDWFVPFAEAVVGFRLGTDERLEVIPWERRQETMKTVMQSDASDPMLDWAKALVPAATIKNY